MALAIDALGFLVKLWKFAGNALNGAENRQLLDLLHLLASALIAISSIHLLQIFMEVASYDDPAITWGLAIHGMFVAGAVALGVLDRLAGRKTKD